MPTNIWQSTNTNWNDPDSWSLAAVPVNDDDVIFPADATKDCLLNVDNQSAVGPLQIRVEKGCSINIGTNSTRLTLGTNNNTLYHKGRGAIYQDTTFSDVVIDAENWVNALDVNENTISRLTILQGKVREKVDASGSIIITRCFVSNTRGEYTAILDIGARKLNVILYLYMTGGRVTVPNITTRAYITGGIVTEPDTGSGLASIVILLMAGGVFKGNNQHTNITTALFMGSTVIARGVADFREQSIPRTFNGFIHPGGYLLAPDNLTINGGALLREPIIT